MTVNPLPPQAYTKETLQKAYTWLLTQSANVKEMASTQEMLVSMYLKAQRSGDAALETPSIQNFKQELKSLATMMGDLQPPANNSFANNSHYSQPNISTTGPSQVSSHFPSTAPSQNARQSHQPSHSANLGVSGMPQSFIPNTPPSSGLLGFLDEHSLRAVQDIKSTLNLSSDVEALRALISLGYKQFRKM